MESFYTGLIGFLIGKGVSPADSKNIIDALQRYLGFEPPIGLTGYALTSMEKGKKYKTSVVVRGKTYSARALDTIEKYQQVAVLSKTGECLDIAPTLTLWQNINVMKELTTLVTLKNIENVENMPNLTLHGSQGLAFLQKSGTQSWETPDSVTDPDNAWSGEADTIDEETSTYALRQNIPGWAWSEFLHWHYSPAIRGNQVRVWISPGHALYVDVDVYIEGVWTNVFEGSIDPNKWVAFPFNEGAVTEFRIREKNETASPIDGSINEVDVFKVTGGEIIAYAKVEKPDIISFGSLASPNGAGVEIVEGTAGKKIKVYDAGFVISVLGAHCFYFGKSPTLTNKRFLTADNLGTFHKTFVHPRIGADGESLYLYSGVSETDMPFDLGYVKE